LINKIIVIFLITFLLMKNGRIMKFNLYLKDTHLDILDELKEKYSIPSNEELVKRYVKSALSLEDRDLIFDVIREKCSSCFSSEPQFEVDMDEEDYEKLKTIFEEYDFDTYFTDEERVSKTIRCIINFAEEEPELISI